MQLLDLIYFKLVMVVLLAGLLYRNAKFVVQHPQILLWNVLEYLVIFVINDNLVSDHYRLADKLVVWRRWYLFLLHCYTIKILILLKLDMTE